MTDELILSKSAIDVWLSCHRKWMYAYAFRVPGAPSLDMAVGTAVHAGVEAHWKGADDPAGATKKVLAREMASMPTIHGADGVQAVADALKMLATYLANIAPVFFPTLVEQDFLIRVDGQLVSGRIDAAETVNDEVHDTKTTSTPSKVQPDKHRLGMTIYRHGFRMLTGRLPNRLVLDVVAKNGRWKQVPVEPDDAGMAEVVGLVSRGIRAGDFAPTGARSGECYRCPFATLCPSANLGVAS